MDLPNEYHQQKIEYARASLWAPFYAVGIAARMQGRVPVERVKAALGKLQILYPPLASRVFLQKNGTAWLTTAGVGEFPLEVRMKTSDDDWGNVFLEQERKPFAFECGPIARFFLLYGEQSTDLVAIAPHVVCDGYSMATVMWDAASLINHPDRIVAAPLPAPAVSWDNIFHSRTDAIFLRGIAKTFNHAWPDSGIIMNQEGYEEMHRDYWEHQQNGLLSFCLSSAEISELAARCRKHGISITGAVAAAFLLAQAQVRPVAKANSFEISVAVNIRDRLVQPPNGSVGVYASSVDLTLHTRSRPDFWELACITHTRLHRALGNRSMILKPLVLEELNPMIADRLIVAISTGRWRPEFGILTRFMKVKGGSRWLDISNIGRVEFPDAGSPYHLENLLPFPPLVPGGNLALNILTFKEQMNIVLKFRKDMAEGAHINQIRETALAYLSQA